MNEDNGLSLESLSIFRLFREKKTKEKRKLIFVSAGDGIRKLWKKSRSQFFQFFFLKDRQEPITWDRSIKYIVYKVATEF